MAASKTLNPEQRKERAKKAARARHSLDTYIQSIVDRQDELTPEHLRLLRNALDGLDR